MPQAISYFVVVLLMALIADTAMAGEKNLKKLPCSAEQIICSDGARAEANARFRLGYMYGTGQGVPKDDAKAVSWYRKAAGQGHARAQYNLGAAYANGTGVIRSKETAVEWFFEAGQSFVREGKRALALRVVDTIERLIPGHVLASELLAVIRARFGQ